MGRKRVYSSAAERQKAYRNRARIPGATPAIPKPTRKPKKASRPARLLAHVEGIRLLLSEYEEWLDQLPESLESSTQADLLTTTIEVLTETADNLEQLQLPRGFGRD